MVLPDITMNTYARARDERLSEAAEAIGALVEPGQIYDTGMTRVAAGAEGLSPNKKAPKACAKGARVEAAGIEPASRGISVYASTRVVDLLILALGDADQQASPRASSQMGTLCGRHRANSATRSLLLFALASLAGKTSRA